jgi:hypothetical protein
VVARHRAPAEQPCDRSRDHDRAAAHVDQRRAERADAEVHAAQVDREHEVKIRDAAVEDASLARDPCVQESDVHAAKALARLGDHAQVVGLEAHVHRAGEGFSALPNDLLGHFTSALRVQVRDANVSAFFCQSKRGCTANP